MKYIRTTTLYGIQPVAEEYVFSYDLQFFAKDGPGGERTEQATPKKLEDARNEGQVAKSKELVNAVALLGLFIILKIYLSYLGNGIMELFHKYLGYFGTVVSDRHYGTSNNVYYFVFREALLDVLKLIWPFLLVSFVIGFIVNLVQVKWKISTKPLEPKLDKFNPINGIKRIFSTKQLVELLKSIAMVAVVGYIAYQCIMDNLGVLFTLYDITLLQAISAVGSILLDMGIRISVAFLVIGVADYAYQKWKFKQDMMMTKQETKDEFKNTEGDPQIKGQIRQRMRDASRRRSIASVPEADVVITNPTHFAVALQYDTEKAPAPIVIAKGADVIAAKIREKARESHVEIVENKPLARLLYHNVEIGEEVPPELYQAVAEVLAYVYSLKNKGVSA